MTEKGEILTDDQVVDLVRTGDKKVFSILVKRHQKALLRLCYRFVKDMDVAEDVVQDAFIKSYERLNTFESRASFKSWLFQIAINTAKNRLRDRMSDMSDIDDVHLSVAPVAEMNLIHHAVSELIQKHVEQLPFKQKTALMLRVYEDLSFKEIAEIMECPYDTAKANYRHALMRLKDELQSNQELAHWTEEMNVVFTDMSRRVAEAES